MAFLLAQQPPEARLGALITALGRGHQHETRGGIDRERNPIAQEVGRRPAEQVHAHLAFTGAQPLDAGDDVPASQALAWRSEDGA